MCILKYLRPDALIPEVKNFIRTHLGEDFVVPPAADIASSFAISAPHVPLIFLISRCTDPMEDILAFARTRNMSEKCRILSLGQDCGSRRIITVLEECIQVGHWVVLQNCHFSGTWLEELEKLFLDMAAVDEEKSFHRDFRLWCTSESYDKFPISILQNSVKMTNESPQGLKRSLRRLFTSSIVPREAIFNNNSVLQGQERDCQRVILGMVLFHTVLQQRQHFGSIGWNCPAYEFNDSDLR